MLIVTLHLVLQRAEDPDAQQAPGGGPVREAHPLPLQGRPRARHLRAQLRREGVLLKLKLNITCANCYRIASLAFPMLQSAQAAAAGFLICHRLPVTDTIGTACACLMALVCVCACVQAVVQFIPRLDLASMSLSKEEKKARCALLQHIHQCCCVLYCVYMHPSAVEHAVRLLGVLPIHTQQPLFVYIPLCLYSTRPWELLTPLTTKFCTQLHRHCVRHVCA
jgi:hypothetical protein